MSAPGPIRGKRDLRLTARDARDALPATMRADAALAIGDRLDREVLARLAAAAPHAVVAVYAPVQSEVDTRPIARHALGRRLRVAYPRVVAPRRLEFALASPDDLIAGAFRIPEPSASAPIVAADAIAAFVVPGIAFDRAGARIGWGHGYYDATLAQAGAALRVGVCFESQLVDDVPVDPTDEPVHLIITEVAVHRCRPVPVAGAPWIPSS